MDFVGNTRFRALPDEAPLEMPVQPLHAERRPAAIASSPGGIVWRRVLVLGGAAMMTAAAGYEMYRVLSVNGLTALGAVMVVLFVLLFGWIALAFTSALAGFWCVLRGDRRLGIDPGTPLSALASRTALLMPTYNEQPGRVFAALQAMEESLQALKVADRFDIFILSDTTDPEIWIAEEAGFLALRQRGGAGRISYRHRSRNTGRKAGNIADWVSRFGAAYPQFLILDADSVMSGETLVRLAAAMERNPDVGLIQTLPVIVGAATLFGRLQQFAARVYGPVIAHGLAWWHGAEGNYWGHNAMIRTQAFASCAGLPVLRGRAPFGGHILSHDFVEAALLRRGGWAVHMVPYLSGSFEEAPPSLTDLAIRDRRWCQGNLQHAAVLPARGLHWISRLHLLTGIGSYAAAPLWLMFLAIGLMIALQARFEPFDYFPAGRSLFPRWPQVDPVRARYLFEVAMAVLLAPKLLGCAAVILLGERRRYGGASRLLLSAGVETVFAGLIAPIAMLTQTIDVIAILAGRDAGWRPQRRDDGLIARGQIARRYWPHTVLGLTLGLSAYWASPFLALWMLPVVAGLLLAIPMAIGTASRAGGQGLRHLGVLRTPEEPAPPAVLRRATDLRETGRAEPAGQGRSWIHRLLADPDLLHAHRAMQPPARGRREGPIPVALVLARARLDEADTLDEALLAMTPAELAAVLADPRGLARLVELQTAPVGSLSAP